MIHSFKSKADARRSISDKIADSINHSVGTIAFLILNLVWFISWTVINLGLVPAIPAFDPYPFGLLTTIVSLEAIILSIFVLIAQNRASKIDEMRDEIDLQVNMIAEQEVTKILHVISLIAKKQGIDLSKDNTLQKMVKPTNTAKIEQKLEEQMGKL